MIKDFYGPFKENLIKKTKEVKKEDFLQKTGEKCPKCKSDMMVKFGRFGKFYACSNYPDCKYTEATAEEKKVQEEKRILS